MSNSRLEKITRYKEQKEQERQLKVRGIYIRSQVKRAAIGFRATSYF